MNSKFE